MNLLDLISVRLELGQYSIMDTVSVFYLFCFCLGTFV